MDQVSQIRDKIDIVALIQVYISLKRAGRNFKAVCPFHSDKTPSLVVSPERQIWHCFGCGKGGDVFTFLMEYEHMEFPEALRTLADQAGIVLQHQQYDSAKTSKKEKIYALNHLAAEFYHYLLTSHTLGKDALSYVTDKRGIKPATLKTYMLGFSPRGNALVTYLIKKKHYAKEDVLEAGLGSPRGNMIVDFFQNRLMFPLYDHRDNIIGFSGRILDNSDKTSKYINTRETLVYHKGLTFFGLNSAKNAIKKEDRAIIMEGEFDVISSFQEGITNAVAVKGTALTTDQVNLVGRFCKQVVLCFDADSAGQEALKRSVPLLEKKGLVTSVLVIPGGKDPDEAIKTDKIAYKKAVKETIPVYDFLLEQAVKKYGTKSSLDKKQIGDDLLPLLSGIENEILKEHYLQLLGRTINTSYETLLKALDKLKKQEVIVRDIVYTSPHQSREEKLEEYVVALIVQHSSPARVIESLSDFLRDYTWKTPSYQKVLLALQAYCVSHPQGVGKDILSSLPQELLPTFDTCFLVPLPSFSDDAKWDEEIKKTAEELFVLYLKDKIKHIGEEIRQKEKDGTAEDLANLQADFSHFVSLLRKK